jgi:hypothetical protein
MVKQDAVLIWLIRGSQRRIVFTWLTPEFLSNKIRAQLINDHKLILAPQDFRKHLRAFQERRLVVCYNPKDPFNRIYALTSRGKEYQRKLQKVKI